jgi:RNA polymerase sigma-70 factor (ECF subfamily)
MAKDEYSSIYRNGKYNEAGKFLPWAMRIIRNLAMDYLRHEKRIPKIKHIDLIMSKTT